MTVAVAVGIFAADVQFDSADLSYGADLLFSFDSGMLAISWPSFSSAAATVAHRSVDPPNVVQLDVDEVIHAANVNVHPAV